MDHSFFQDLVVVFGLGLVVALAFTRMRLPLLVGYLFTGTVVGPYGLKLVQDRHNVETLAEVGVVALLFIIGIEFSLPNLVRYGSIVLLGGGLQMVITGTAAALIAWMLGLPPGPAMIVGCVVTLSSTAIVLRVLSDRGETETPQGRIALGILIFQDLAAVALILAIPFMAGQGGGWSPVLLTLAKAVGLVVGVLVLARRVVPWFLRMVVATRSRELFLLSVVLICLGTAWLTAEFGLSLALGAFLAGLVVSESEYGHHALSTVMPFQDVFSSLFFVSIGMLLDVNYVFQNPLPVLGATLAVVFGKALVVMITSLVLGQALRIAVLAGLVLAQIGEFSFLLIHAAAQLNALSTDTHQMLIAISIATMALTPMIVRISPAVADWISRGRGGPAESEVPTDLEDHVVIVGFGINGQNVALALRRIDMKYRVVELNPQTVKNLGAEQPILFGDATQEETLRSAGVHKARVLVLTLPDAAATRRIVQTARLLNPGVHVIVRTRFVREVDELYRLGASEVVPEEFETSIEIFSRVLRKYLVPRDVVENLVREVRQQGYGALRGMTRRFRPVTDLRSLLSDVELEVIRVETGSAVDGQTLGEADFKQRTGALVLGVRREGKTISSPPADLRLGAGDGLLVFGPPTAITAAGELLRGSPPSTRLQSSPAPQGKAHDVLDL